ncbi:hypothetical protein Bbelb_076490 [Branchiostoma belcheri]|nr:hypothetical protein Bbelb_076490 [Branchiostoma belcheri]
MRMRSVKSPSVQQRHLAGDGFAAEGLFRGKTNFPAQESSLPGKVPRQLGGKSVASEVYKGGQVNTEANGQCPMPTNTDNERSRIPVPVDGCLGVGPNLDLDINVSTGTYLLWKPCVAPAVDMLEDTSYEKNGENTAGTTPAVGLILGLLSAALAYNWQGNP